MHRPIPFILTTAFIVVGIIVVSSCTSNSQSSAGTRSISFTEESQAEIDTVIPPAEKPYTIDEVIENLEEYDRNLTPKERAEEPAEKWKKQLQGSYLIDRDATMADDEMVHTYGKYVISGNTISYYSWNENRGSWENEFSSEYQLFKFHEDGYMSGYNLIYIDLYGNECRMCSGDCNDDGKMDLWQSDSLFWTKQ